MKILAILAPRATSLAVAMAVALAGCNGSPVVEQRPVYVNVPVPQPCVDGRPLPVKPLKQRYSDHDWDSLDVRQKAAAVARQGLNRMTYGEDLNAATGACQAVTGER